MKFDVPPKENKEEKKIFNEEDLEGTKYKSLVNSEINDSFRVLNNQFLIERLGGIERSINKSLVPTIFNSPEHASLGTSCIIEYFIKNNISTEQQLQFLKGVQLSLNDIQLLSENKNATYEYVQFAYQWAGLARDEWDLSQESIKSILDETIKSFNQERIREDLPYLTSIYLDPENMLSRKPKIERFMQNMTPNLIDEVNHIYHFDSTGENPLFLKLDTEEKRKEVKDLLFDVRKGWDKMFKENPTVKMYTHYPLPEEFNKFVLSDDQVKDYFPHIAFNKNGEILRENMKNMLNPGLREALSHDIGIDLTKLQQEQVYFIEYISKKKKGEILPLKNFVDIYGNEGLKTFVSCSHDEKMGDKILKLGNPDILPKEIAEKIFKKYGELVDSVEGITEALSQKLNTSELVDLNSKLIVTENLLRRAKNLLEKYADNLNKNPEEIIEEIERIKAENILTLSIFQSLRDTKGIKFEDVKDFSFKNKSSLSLQEQSEAREIIKKNYKDSPQEAQDAIMESFNNSLKTDDKEVNFPILKNKGRVAAFMRLDFGKYKETEDYGKKVYFGSFNVDPDFANGEIGSAMIERSVDNIAKTHIIEADCNAEQNIGAKYIESGFTAIGFYDFKGLPGFKIIRDDKLKNRIIGKNLSKEEIISNITKGFYENDLGKIKIISSSSQKELLPNFKEELDGSKIISRYFYDKNDKQWIAVIENNIFSKESE